MFLKRIRYRETRNLCTIVSQIILQVQLLVILKMPKLNTTVIKNRRKFCGSVIDFHSATCLYYFSE